MDVEEESSFSGLKTIQLNDQKAGMQGLDKNVINKIIYEASKGTPYFAFQEKRQKSIDSKVNELLVEMEKLTESERKSNFEKMNNLAKNLENERDLSHSIVHIDMDAFYAAVEMLDNPELKEKPMAVGSSSMLSTSNYHARKFGVRAAMPGFIAKKLCPDLTIVPCNFEKYRAVSHKIRQIVAEYDPDYCATSLDEVYLDLTDYILKKYRKTFHEEHCVKNSLSESFGEDGNPDTDCIDDFMNCMNCGEPINNELRDKMAFDIVNEIRSRIFDVTQLTASAGIAPNTMLAKVCSDQNKPNGQYQISSTIEAVKSFISTLPVKKVSGIGPVQGQILNAIGIHTCADMWTKRDLVASLFTPTSVDFYMRVALGIGSTTVKSEHIRKSIGNEQTFKEIYKKEDLHKKCEELCDDLIEDLKSRNMMGKVIVLKIKTTKFETHTRNHSLPYYTADQEVIYNSAKKLLDNEIAAAAPQPLKLRLMGVRMCNLMHEDALTSSEKQPVTLKHFLQSRTNAKTKISPEKCKEASSYSDCLQTFENNFDTLNEQINSCQHYNYFNNDDVTKLTVSKEEEPSNGKSSISSTETMQYICPICESDTGVDNLLNLNLHIDNCLSKAAIKQILASDIQNAPKRKTSNSPQKNSKKLKGSGKEKRIDEYFL